MSILFICPNHGILNEEVFYCPECQEPCVIVSYDKDKIPIFRPGDINRLDHDIFFKLVHDKFYVFDFWKVFCDTYFTDYIILSGSGTWIKFKDKEIIIGEPPRKLIPADVDPCTLLIEVRTNAVWNYHIVKTIH